MTVCQYVTFSESIGVYFVKIVEMDFGRFNIYIQGGREEVEIVYK